MFEQQRIEKHMGNVLDWIQHFLSNPLYLLLDFLLASVVLVLFLQLCDCKTLVDGASDCSCDPTWLDGVLQLVFGILATPLFYLLLVFFFPPNPEDMRDIVEKHGHAIGLMIVEERHREKNVDREE